MFYLFMAILSSSSIAIIFKFTESKKRNRMIVTAANYMMASLVSLLMLLKDIKYIKPDNSSLIKDISVLAGGGKFGSTAAIQYSVVLGIISGIMFFLSFIIYQICINKNGASISGAFGKLGILIPMLFSIIIWNEIPSFIQSFGIVLALISIITANLPSENEKKNFNFLLIILFISGGLADFSNKFFQKYADEIYKNIFLFFVFFTALIISLTIIIVRKSKFTLKDIIPGLIVGIPNLFSSFFLIKSLQSVKTSVAYSLYSSGTIIFITVFSYLFFREIPSVKKRFAILFSVAALVLINI